MVEPRASRPFWPDALKHPGHPTEGLLPWKWALERLERSHNYWIATTRPGGQPHVMVVWAVWLEEAIWFSTGPNTRKVKNLSVNPNCVVCTENADEAVIVEGRAEMVSGPAQRKQFAGVYDRKYGGDIGELLESKEGIVVRVLPRLAFGFDEHAQDFVQAATRWKFGAE